MQITIKRDDFIQICLRLLPSNAVIDRQRSWAQENFLQQGRCLDPAAFVGSEHSWGTGMWDVSAELRPLFVLGWGR